MLNILQIILFSVVFLMFPSFANASGFIDHFNKGDNNNWNFISNSGKIDFKDSYIILSSDRASFPYVVSKNFDFGVDENLSLEIKFKFLNTGDLGTGIGIGFTGLSGKYFNQFLIWNDKPDGTYFAYNDFNNERQGYCKNFNIASNLDGRIIKKLNNINNWRILRINKIKDVFEVFLDSELIYATLSNQCNPNTIWFGNYTYGGSYNWSNLEVDYIKYGALNDDSKKIIIVPGLGASWNTSAIVFNQNEPNANWKMTPFVHDYDNLIKALDDKGLNKDEDYFVWNYDWRKPVEEIVGNLKDFIDKNILEEDKVYLVGHSLGGVIARIYDQNYDQENDKIEKIISIAGPQKGAVKAYEVWSGGKLSENDVESTGINLFLTLQRLNGFSKIKNIRNFVPILKDLLPINDFVKINNSYLPVSRMESSNSYLAEKNNNWLPLNSKFISYSGSDFPTKATIIVNKQTELDKILGVWPDGKPIKYFYDDGDSTVLKSSTTIGNSFPDRLFSGTSHLKIVDNSINQVLRELELGEIESGLIKQDNIEQNTFVYSNLPGNFSVLCDENDQTNSKEGFVTIKSDQKRECEVRLLPTADGEYKIVFGNFNDPNNWQYYYGSVLNGVQKQFNIDSTTGELIVNNNNNEWVYNSIKKGLEDLRKTYNNSSDLFLAIKAVDQKNSDLLIKYLFGFRKSTKETNISSYLISLTEYVLAEKNLNVSASDAKNAYLKMLQKKSVIDTKLRLDIARRKAISAYTTTSYEKLNELIESAQTELNKKNYWKLLPKKEIFMKYSSEII